MEGQSSNLVGRDKRNLLQRTSKQGSFLRAKGIRRHMTCYIAFVVFTFPYKRGKLASGGFTLVEAAVAVVLVGIGITSAITALTKFNAFASVSRNSTGAYSTVMNQIDAIESATPFNPQHLPDPQIPDVLKLDTERTGGKPLKEDVSVYLYKDPTPGSTSNIIIVKGERTTSVNEANQTSNGVNLYMRRVKVTVDYTYLSRKYSFSMSTLRASDQ
jgi:type II secretory pathway pseudopilin PulG